MIFILSKYSEKAFEISIARKIFRDKEGGEVNSRIFNFGYFLLMLIKYLLNCCCSSERLKSTQNYIEVSDEASNQLDIAYILRRLNYYDSALQLLLSKTQEHALCLKEKPQIDVIKKRRIRIFAS